MNHPNTRLIAVVQDNTAIQYLAKLFGGSRLVMGRGFDETLQGLIAKMREMGVYPQ